jgi:hypothetical protein
MQAAWSQSVCRRCFSEEDMGTTDSGIFPPPPNPTCSWGTMGLKARAAS